MALPTKILSTGSITAQTVGTNFRPQLIRDSTGHLQILVNDNPTTFEIRLYGQADEAAGTSPALIFSVTNATATPGVNGTDWVQSDGTPGLGDTASIITPALPLWPVMRVDIHAISGTGDFDIWLLE